jgi:hypothetical protein
MVLLDVILAILGGPPLGCRCPCGNAAALLSIRVISPRQSSITLEVIRGLGCRAFRLNGAQISIHYLCFAKTPSGLYFQ